MAKACGVWDVDTLEEQIPQALVAEWNQYLNWEIAQWTQAIFGAVGFGRGGDGAIKLTDPNEIMGFFDSITRGD